MSKKAVIIYGPPGAGKGTQANLLAWRYNFVHFDTGKYLEQLVHDPEKQKDPVIKRERENFDRGVLTTPKFALKIISQKTKEISQAGFSVVFSGSPRTLYEAFGSKTENRKSRQGLIDLLEKEYGKNNIYLILLKIKPEIAILRNRKRLVCSVCGNAVLYNKDIHEHKVCSLCGGKLKRRVVDDPKLFKVRIKEYKERTLPILMALKKRGYKIIEIDGRPMPYQVHSKIVKALNL